MTPGQALLGVTLVWSIGFSVFTVTSTAQLITADTSLATAGAMAWQWIVWLTTGTLLWSALIRYGARVLEPGMTPPRRRSAANRVATGGV